MIRISDNQTKVTEIGKYPIERLEEFKALGDIHDVEVSTESYTELNSSGTGRVKLERVVLKAEIPRFKGLNDFWIDVLNIKG